MSSLAKGLSPALVLQATTLGLEALEVRLNTELSGHWDHLWESTQNEKVNKLSLVGQL